MMTTNNNARDAAEDDDEDRFCVRDGTTVSGEAACCLHPSSYCEFRETCPVRIAERARRRDSGHSSDSR